MFDVTKRDCLRALKVVREKKVGLSDAIAYVIVKEIYSFDRDFDRLNVKRVTD